MSGWSSSDSFPGSYSLRIEVKITFSCPGFLSYMVKAILTGIISHTTNILSFKFWISQRSSLLFLIFFSADPYLLFPLAYFRLLILWGYSSSELPLETSVSVIDPWLSSYLNFRIIFSGFGRLPRYFRNSFPKLIYSGCFPDLLSSWLSWPSRQYFFLTPLSDFFPDISVSSSLPDTLCPVILAASLPKYPTGQSTNLSFEHPLFEILFRNLYRFRLFLISLGLII